MRRPGRGAAGGQGVPPGPGRGDGEIGAGGQPAGRGVPQEAADSGAYAGGADVGENVGVVRV